MRVVKQMLESRRHMLLGIVASVLLLISVVGVLALHGVGASSRTSGSIAATSPSGSVSFQVPTSGGTTVPRASTPGVTPSEATPGASQATPTAGVAGTPPPGATPTATIPVPTPPTCPPMDWCPSTPSPTSTLPPYDAQAVGPTAPVTVTGASVISAYLVVQNTGSMPWYTWQAFSFVCTSNCMGAPGSNGVNTIAPGQTVQYGLSLHPPYPWTVGTYDSHWTMELNGVPFGHDLVLQVTVTRARSLLSQAAPSCGNPAGVSWNWQNSSGGNTVFCTDSGLVMQESGGAMPEADVTTIPSPYDANDFEARVHVHFSTSSTSTYAGFVIHAPASNSDCGGEILQVNAEGAYRVEFDIPQSSGGCTRSIVSGSRFYSGLDYDLEVDVAPGSEALNVNNNAAEDGGDSRTGGLTGLAVWDGTGTSSQVTFSNFEIVDPNITPTDQFVIAPA